MSDSLFTPRDRIGDGIGDTWGEFQFVPLLSYESGGEREGERGEEGEGGERGRGGIEYHSS